MRCEGNTSKTIKGETPGVADDTTNKGPRPRGPTKARGEGRVILRVFSFHVDLIDTANKSCLLQRNKTGGTESHTLIDIFNI